MDVPLKFEGSDLTPDLYIGFKYHFSTLLGISQTVKQY